MTDHSGTSESTLAGGRTGNPAPPPDRYDPQVPGADCRSPLAGLLDRSPDRGANPRGSDQYPRPGGSGPTLHRSRQFRRAVFASSNLMSRSLLGSAGTVTANADLADDADLIVIIYADNLSDIDLRPLLAFHRTHGDPFTMVLFHAPNPRACGIAELDCRGTDRVVHREARAAGDRPGQRRLVCRGCGGLSRDRQARGIRPGLRGAPTASWDECAAGSGEVTTWTSALPRRLSKPGGTPPGFSRLPTPPRSEPSARRLSRS